MRKITETKYYQKWYEQIEKMSLRKSTWSELKRRGLRCLGNMLRRK